MNRPVYLDDDPRPDVSPEEELAVEVELYERWQDEQDARRMDRLYTARWHNHLRLTQEAV